MSITDEFNARTIAEFRAHHGKVGHVFERFPSLQQWIRSGAPLLLLHTVGARSGQPRINPLMYLKDGERYVVFASKSGADTNPDWYWNLKVHPDAQIEVEDESSTPVLLRRKRRILRLLESSHHNLRKSTIHR